MLIDISITRSNNHMIIIIQTYGINEETKVEINIRGNK